MWRKALWVLAVVMSLAVPSIVRAQGDYLDVYTVKVKPEKIVEFEGLARKFADANRRNGGDQWLTMRTAYGDGGVYTFVSTRKDYAESEKAEQAFMAATNKTFGNESEKLMGGWMSCLLSSRSELRRRRWDLSRKVPADAAAYAKFIGESRLLRTTAIRVRPGHIAGFEALLKEVKDAAEKNPGTPPVFVSQVIEGSKGTVFYVTTLRNSMAGFDKNLTTREILGEDAFKKWLQVNAEVVESTESSLLRFAPELSSPPEDVASASAEFWNPKPAMSAGNMKAGTKKKAEVKPAADKAAPK